MNFWKSFTFLSEAASFLQVEVYIVLKKMQGIIWLTAKVPNLGYILEKLGNIKKHRRGANIVAHGVKLLPVTLSSHIRALVHVPAAPFLTDLAVKVPREAPENSSSSCALTIS